MTLKTNKLSVKHSVCLNTATYFGFYKNHHELVQKIKVSIYDVGTSCCKTWANGMALLLNHIPLSKDTWDHEHGYGPFFPPKNMQSVLLNVWILVTAVKKVM